MKQLFSKKILMGLTLILLTVAVSKAATYYCDPSSGSMSNSGSSTSPWSTLEAVFAANKTFAPGDIIYLRNGYHGQPTVKGNNSGYVTIKAQAGHTPTAARLFVNGGQRWIIDGLTVSPEIIGVYLTQSPKIAIVDIYSNSSYITIQNCHVYAAANISGWSGGLVSSRFPIGIESDGPYTKITNSLIESTFYEVVINKPAHHSEVSYNTIRKFSGDGMRGLSDDSKFEYNYVHTCYSIDQHHDDGFQSWSLGSTGVPGAGTIYRVTVRGNTIINVLSTSQPFRSGGYGMQGIGNFDGWFDSWVIENNLVVTDMYHGLSFYGARNCKMVNNTVLKNPLNNQSMTPWIAFYPHKNNQSGYNNIMRNNITPIIKSTNGTTQDHNLVTSSYTSHFINYYGFDFRLKSGSSAINGGSASSAPAIDLNQFPRSGNPDIGCYEYGTPVPNPGQGGGIIDEEPPSTPGTPVVTGTSIASVSLSWSASTDDVGVTGYNIYVNGALGTTSTSASATVGGLTPGTQYTFTVSAYDAAGNQSAQSSSTQGSTQSGSIIDATSATASSYEAPDNVPANAIDDNLTTRWASNGDGQWLQLDLGGSANITDIGLAFYMGDQRTYSFDLQASTNGTTWTTIYSGSSSGSTTGIEMFDVTDANASYIRYLGHGNSANTWNNVNEIVFYSAGPPDTQAPSIPSGLTVGTVTTSSVALSWSASTDNVGVTGYKVYVNGSNPQTFGTTSATIEGLADNTTYIFTVSAIDAAGNESAQSSSVQATTVEITGVTSSTTWQSFQESTQTGEFTATFTAIPNGNNIDVLTGIQNGSASAYGDMACIIRFNTSGNIDARNGGAYAATNTVSYSSGISYAFRVEVDVTSHTYDVFVTPQGGSEQTVASNFAFRTEQASVSQLTGWTVYGYQGTHTVDNMTFSTGVDTQAPSVPSGLTVGTITTSSVALSWSASSDNVEVTGYKVYTNGANPQPVAGTSATISGLDDGTTYNFTVSAVDAASNESAQSAQVQATTDGIDGEAPSVPGTPVASNITTNSVDLSWAQSYDNVAVVGYKVYTNGSYTKTVTTTNTTMSGLAQGTTYSFTVSAIDAIPLESAQSSATQVTTDQITSVTSSTTWQSFQESTQTGTFTATFDAVPNGNGIDALTGIQNGSASAYGDMACIIRFNTSGNIDARNGGTYTATNTVSYSSGTSYAFRVEVNVPAHTYSVYVTPQGGSEQTVASNFAFRTEQASVSQLTGWTVYAYQGTHTVDNMVFDDGSTPDTQAPSVPTGLVAGTVTTSSVALSWSASSDNVGVTGYKVYINGSNPQSVAGTSATINGLTASTQYSFTVSAVDGASNESAQSNVLQVTTDDIPAGIDLITNGEFDNGTTGWGAGNYGGTASLAAVTGQGMSGVNAMQISISAAGTNAWDIQIYQDIQIESGHTYEISFDAKAASNRSIAAIIQDFDSPWAEYWHQDVNLTTSAQSFGPYTFNSSTTDATCRFKFFVGGNASTVYVDNIVVNDVTSSSAEVELASNEASFKLYPNPLSGNTLTVELSGYDTEVNVAIFDMTGRVVYNTVENVVDNSLVKIPSDILNKGIYIISVKGEGINKQQKLVVE